MTGTEQNKDRDGKSPELKKDTSDGDGTRKPGLIIDVVLPDDQKEIERDPKKQN